MSKKTDFEEYMNQMEKEDKWVLPILFILGIIVFVFFILVITGNLYYLFELFRG